MWKIWAEGKDSLLDIQEKWSIDDLFNAHDAMNIKAEISDQIQKQVSAEEKAKAGTR